MSIYGDEDIDRDNENDKNKTDIRNKKGITKHVITYENGIDMRHILSTISSHARYAFTEPCKFDDYN